MDARCDGWVEPRGLPTSAVFVPFVYEGMGFGLRGKLHRTQPGGRVPACHSVNRVPHCRSLSARQVATWPVEQFCSRCFRGPRALEFIAEIQAAAKAVA